MGVVSIAAKWLLQKAERNPVFPSALCKRMKQNEGKSKGGRRKGKEKKHRKIR